MTRLAMAAILLAGLAGCTRDCPAPGPAPQAKQPAPAAAPVSMLWPKKDPAPAKQPMFAAPKPVKTVVVRPKAQPRPKAKPKRHKSAVAAPSPYWCSRIPAGTTMAQVDAAASGFGKKLTAAQRRQTQACIASK